MSYTSEKKAASIIPFENVSDIPTSEINGLTHDELLLIFSRRFKEAGEPWDLLQRWLDDHYVGYQGQDPQARVLTLDWFAMGSLMRESRDWANPPYSDID